MSSDFQQDLSGMSEMQFDKILEKRDTFSHAKSIFDEVRKMLRNYGIIIVGECDRIPNRVDIDCSEHDRKYTEKIRELAEQIAKQSDLIRGYDDEILKLKAQCQKLTENERISYQRLNGDKNKLMAEPIKIADWLIDRHTEQVEKMSVSLSDLDDMRKLEIDNLRQIAEHLLVFRGRKQDV